MSDNQGSTNAQVPVNPPEAGGNASPGVQQRIDELVAQLHEQRRMVEEAQNKNNILVQAMLEQQQRQSQAQQPQVPQIEVDPEQAKVVSAVVDPRISALEKQLALMHQTIVQRDIQQVAQNLPPEVVKRAEELKLNWSRSGLNGWQAQDAVTYALGEYQQKQLLQSNMQTQRQNYNQLSQNVTGAGAPAPAPAPQNPGYALPKNIDSLPLSEQLKYYEQSGIGNIPIE